MLHGSPPTNLYFSAKTHLASFRVRLAELLKNYLNDKIYQEYFQNSKVDKFNRYLFDDAQDEPQQIIRYKRILNLLTNIERMLEKIGQSHNPIIETTSFPKLLLNSKVLYQNFWQCLESIWDFYGEMEPLGAMELIYKMSTPEGVRSVVSKLLPVDITFLEDAANANTFVQSYQAASTDSHINALKTCLDQLSSSLSKEGKARQSIPQTLDSLQSIMNEVNQGKNTSNLDALKLLYAIYPTLSNLLQTMPQSYITLSSVFKKQFLASLEQINSIFKNTVLRIDKMEIEGFLKEGTLRDYPFYEKQSILDMAFSFNQWVENLGYQFPTNSRFPYYPEIRKQRKALAADLTTLQAKVNSQKQKEITQSQTLEKKWLDEQKASIINSLDKRIAKLKKDRKKWFSSKKSREAKITLLTKMIAEIPNHISLQDTLTQLSSSIPASDVQYLQQGKTGKLLNKLLKEESATPDDQIRLLQDELEKQNKSLKHWYNIFTKKSITKNILLLEKVRNSLMKPGYRIADILLDMGAENPDDYQFLINKNKSLFKEIHKIDLFIPDHLIGKKIIDTPDTVISIGDLFNEEEPIKAAEPAPLTILDSYVFIKTKMASFETMLLNQLKENLDTDLYKLYFEGAAKDASGRYLLTEQDGNKTILYYKRFLNLLTDAQSLITELTALHTPFWKYMSGSGWLQLAANGPSLYQSLWRFFQAYNDVYNNLEPLGANELMLKFTTQQLPFQVTDLTKRFENNPFYVSLTSQSTNWVKIVNISSGYIKKDDDAKKTLDSIQEIIDGFTQSLPKNSLQQESIHKTGADVLRILQEVRKFANSPKNLFDALAFVYTAYPTVKDLIANLPLTKDSLTVVFKDHILETVKLINQVFKDIYLLLDQAEIQMYLKEHALSRFPFQDNVSIESIAEQFNILVEGYGYQFPEVDRFPYQVAIGEQRINLQQQNIVTPEFIQKRIDGMKQWENPHEIVEVITEKEFTENRSNKMTNIIQQRIDELESEKTSWLAMNFKIKQHKIDLLNELLAILPKMSLNKALAEISKGPNKKYMYLLYEGRTKKVLNFLETQFLSPNHQVDSIRLAIQGLKKNYRKGFFFTSKQKIYKQRIESLKLLENLMILPGYRINDALVEISAKNPELHKILITHERKFIDRLQLQDGTISDHLVGRKIIK